MIAKAGLIWRTIRHLKPQQIFYQIKYKGWSKARPLFQYETEHIPTPLPLTALPYQRETAAADKKFTYLNLSKKFDQEIDWNFSDYGKLWNYNLQYIDFINQESLPEEIRISWLKDLYSNLYSGTLKLEPYPVSLRSMNIIRFFSQGEKRIQLYPDILKGLAAELNYLSRNLEYHLLGNHLLENAFSLLMGGYFFQNKSWKDKASKLLKQEINEQILDDGAHFELSPMYHQIILFRVFEALSYITTDDELFYLLKDKAEKMLGWLEQITFYNGDIPHFNDSSNDIAFTSNRLFESGRLLGLSPISLSLSGSGYRKFKGTNFEFIADVNGIAPVYQPGHNHADHLSFVLYVNQKPLFIDPGVSTYSISLRRQWERSSKAHNTVTVDDSDQSEVWGGFRVGRRVKVELVEDTSAALEAKARYKGAGKTNIEHTRRFIFQENQIVLNDALNTAKAGKARFYLHPDTEINGIDENSILLNNEIKIFFENSLKIQLNNYQFAKGYNKLAEAKVIEAEFIGSLKSIIQTH